MHNIETFHNKKTVSAETVGFRFEANLFKSVPMFRFWLSWTTLRRFTNRKWLLAETARFTFEADLFKSGPMILGFGCHGQHWDVSPQENGCCGIRWCQARTRPFQIRTDYHRFLLSCTTLNVWPQENGWCRNRWFQMQSWFVQISTDDHKLLLQWTPSRRFKIRIWLRHKPLVSDSKLTSSNQYRWS